MQADRRVASGPGVGFWYPAIRGPDRQRAATLPPILVVVQRRVLLHFIIGACRNLPQKLQEWVLDLEGLRV